MGTALAPLAPGVSAEFASSISRDVKSIDCMAAAAPKPAGHALPALLPGPVATMSDRVDFTAWLNPSVVLLSRVILRWEWMVGKACTDPSALLKRRLDNPTFLPNTAERRCASNIAWVARQIHGRPSRNVNFGLQTLPRRPHVLSLRGTGARYLHRHADGRKRGTYPCLPRRGRPSDANLHEWMEGLPGRYRRMLGRSKRSAATDFPRIFCEWDESEKRSPTMFMC